MPREQVVDALAAVIEQRAAILVLDQHAEQREITAEVEYVRPVRREHAVVNAMLATVDEQRAAVVGDRANVALQIVEQLNAETRPRLRRHQRPVRARFLVEPRHHLRELRDRNQPGVSTRKHVLSSPVGNDDGLLGALWQTTTRPAKNWFRVSWRKPLETGETAT